MNQFPVSVLLLAFVAMLAGAVVGNALLAAAGGSGGVYVMAGTGP